MAEVRITKRLEDEINKKFKSESVKVFELMYSLKDFPHKGKSLGNVGKILIKEIRYKSFRFYFITDGFKLKIMNPEEIKNLLIQFVRMSNKNNQQKVIDEIKSILIKFGGEGFSYL